MPTVFRFFMILVVFVAVFAALVFSLGNLVAPNTRQLTIRLPPSRLEPRPVAPEPATIPPSAIVESDSGADGETP